MPGESIRPGAVVRLKSGGPAMTVVKKIPACWECTWFDGAERCSATFVEFELAGSGEPCGDNAGDPSGFKPLLVEPLTLPLQRVRPQCEDCGHIVNHKRVERL